MRDGDVDGWRWGSGTPSRAAAPPVVTFEDVCGEENPPTATEVRLPTATPSPRGGLQVMPSVTPEPPLPATTGPRFTPTPAPTPTPAERELATGARPGGNNGPNLVDYLLFAAIGAFLIVGAFVTARRRRRRWKA
ncbi:MAG: hypothetical protein Q9O62_01175 [Ardenticatenia bacterium]|nr:hypothetical protein [Ardenticatenia bacterium]